SAAGITRDHCVARERTSRVTAAAGRGRAVHNRPAVFCDEQAFSAAAVVFAAGVLQCVRYGAGRSARWSAIAEETAVGPPARRNLSMAKAVGDPVESASPRLRIDFTRPGRLR